MNDKQDFASFSRVMMIFFCLREGEDWEGVVIWPGICPEIATS